MNIMIMMPTAAPLLPALTIIKQALMNGITNSTAHSSQAITKCLISSMTELAPINSMIELAPQVVLLINSVLMKARQVPSSTSIVVPTHPCTKRTSSITALIPPSIVTLRWKAPMRSQVHPVYLKTTTVNLQRKLRLLGKRCAPHLPRTIAEEAITLIIRHLRL
uniref:Uncharacterized protein n=1 Tax=Cacopsylla melanoneura TaxID=428564 RepID=A0A8D8R4W1_9HEMI